MKVKFNKLWKLLIDKEMTKTDLIEKTSLSKSTMAKLSKGKNVNVSVLVRICDVLNCEIGDIVELSKEEANESN